jgi:hypothetical protein
VNGLYCAGSAGVTGKVRFVNRVVTHLPVEKLPAIPLYVLIYYLD